MNKSEIRIQNNKLRRKYERRRHVTLALLTCCLVFILSLTVNSFLANAKSNQDAVKIKYYKSILVESGDTLWSIASENTDGNCSDIEACVQEIMQMNGLCNDQITAGSYLIIPYFSTEFVG